MNRPLVNRKNKTPSHLMLPPDGQRYRCRWLEDSITVHSDGNVSCGLDDPHANRSFGNIRLHPISDVFNNPERDRLRDKLAAGFRCHDCSLYEIDANPEPEATVARTMLPTTLVVETTVRCNLRCPNAACIPNNSTSLKTRDKDNLDVDLFNDLIGQIGAGLERVYFFNYGDPFMNKYAEDMLEHLRSERPLVEIITSTNGIPLAKERRAERVVATEVDHITFTISGVRQDSYERYHVNGNVNLALQGLENVCAAKRRLGLDRPRVVWRYLLFRWNDSDAELSQALDIAERIGVDQFSLYLTHIPEGSASYRLSPGSPSYRKFERYIDAAHGYNCEIPDADGLYGIENQTHLGQAHWASAQCRLRFSGQSAWINVALSTLDCADGPDGQTVVIRAPWTTIRLKLQPNVWREICIRVPKSYRSNDLVELQLSTDDYFFPAEQGSADLRCLGLLVRPQAEPARRLSWTTQWINHFRTLRSAVAPEHTDAEFVPMRKSVKSFLGGGRFVGFSGN